MMLPLARGSNIFILCLILESHLISTRHRSRHRSRHHSPQIQGESLIEESVYNFRPPSHFSHKNPGKYQHPNIPKHKTPLQQSTWTQEDDSIQEERERPSSPRPRSIPSPTPPDNIDWSNRNRPHFGHPGNNDPFKIDHNRHQWNSKRRQKNHYPPLKPITPSLPPNLYMSPPKEAWNHVYSHHQLENENANGHSKPQDKVTTLWSIGPHGGYALTEEKRKPTKTDYVEPWRESEEHEEEIQFEVKRVQFIPLAPPPTSSQRPPVQNQNTNNWLGPGITPPPYRNNGGAGGVIGLRKRTTSTSTRTTTSRASVKPKGDSEADELVSSAKKTENKNKAWGVLAQRDSKNNPKITTTISVTPIPKRVQPKKKIERRAESSDEDE